MRNPVSVPSCVFCEIIGARLPGTFVHRDDRVAAILDIHPVNPGHLLVMPVAHAESLAVLPSETGSAMFALAQSLAAAVRRSGLRCQGVNLVLSDEACAGQDVFHSHLHVIPRFSGDGVSLRFRAAHASAAARDELQCVAEAIRRSVRL